MKNLIFALLSGLVSSLAYGDIGGNDESGVETYQTEMLFSSKKVTVSACKKTGTDLKGSHSALDKRIRAFPLDVLKLFDHSPGKMGIVDYCRGDTDLKNGHLICNHKDGSWLTHTLQFYAPGISVSAYTHLADCTEREYAYRLLESCFDKTRDIKVCLNAHFENTILSGSYNYRKPFPKNPQAGTPNDILKKAAQYLIDQDKAYAEKKKEREKSVDEFVGEELGNTVPFKWYQSSFQVKGGRVPKFGHGCSPHSNETVGGLTLSQSLAFVKVDAENVHGYTCETSVKKDYGYVLCKRSNGDKISVILSAEKKACEREVRKMEVSIAKNKLN